MKMVCKTCNVEQPAYFFRTSSVNGKKYYNTKKCKTCQGIKAKYVEDIKIELSNDCKKLLYRIDLMKGDVGVIDCYKIIHNYLIYYDYFESAEDVSVLDELIYMYDKLKELN
jgi:hypothetical protein